ncbi:MAG TPA: hypothetical protein VFW87_22175 [Pirellulales bacterium]|nr:hypothetical protein [Pirellulales bacterium]
MAELSASSFESNTALADAAETTRNGDIAGELHVAQADQASLGFIGQWRGLVSTTNWEKGRIIHEWRETLRAAGAAATQYSDEAWSRRVGQVSSQHVGRLRRVYERFHAQREQFPRLYWSHFQAALDWADAEMWLEGAVQSAWPVSEMRSRRWEALGGVAAEKPRDAEVVEAEFDEDADPAAEGELSEVRDPGDERNGDRGSRLDDAQGDEHESEVAGSQSGVAFDVDAADYPVDSPDAPVRPFANLAELPDDLTEAFESFKLAILHHKLAGWREVSRDDVLASLDSLKQLALAPTET